MEEAIYSTNVYDLLKKKPPFLIRYGYIFLVLFIVSFCIIGNNIKVPILFHLSYVKVDYSTSSFVFKALNKEFIKTENIKKIYIVNGDNKLKIEQLKVYDNELFIRVSCEEYLILQNSLNDEFCLMYFISLTSYIYNFLFNI